jgi:hypothetical protein
VTWKEKSHRIYFKNIVNTKTQIAITKEEAHLLLPLPNFIPAGDGRIGRNM